MITASATTYRPRPRYCVDRLTAEGAQLVAIQLTTMNAPSTISQLILAADHRLHQAGVCGRFSKTASIPMKARIAPARLA